MSLGYRAEFPEIKAAIRDVFHKGTIIIAAASNSGVNPRYPISFPGNIRQVICVHSSDGEGNPSPGLFEDVRLQSGNPRRSCGSSLAAPS